MICAASAIRLARTPRKSCASVESDVVRCSKWNLTSAERQEPRKQQSKMRLKANSFAVTSYVMASINSLDHGRRGL